MDPINMTLIGEAFSLSKNEELFILIAIAFVFIAMAFAIFKDIKNRNRYFNYITLDFKKILSNTFKRNPHKRYVGVEIECLNNKRKENQFEKEDLEKFNMSQISDGSLSDGKGIEFVSLPINGDKLLDNNTKFCTELINRKYYVNRTCGTHIHLEVDNQDLELLKKIYLFYQNFEPYFFKMLPKSRQGSQYCEKFKALYPYNYSKAYQILKEIPTLNKFKEFIYETEHWRSELDLKVDTNQKRYCWINMHSIFYRGTLEVRAHSGTINPRKINNWILMHLKILDFLEKSSLEKINSLQVNEKVFLSLFNSNTNKYIKERWDVFNKQYCEDNKKEYSEYIKEKK